MKMTDCWLAQFSDRSCQGQIVRAHLLSKQLIARTFPNGAVFLNGRWRAPLEAMFIPAARRQGLTERSLEELQHDERASVPACGGIMGNTGHHGQFDRYQLHIPTSAIPPATYEYARELGLDWALDPARDRRLIA